MGKVQLKVPKVAQDRSMSCWYAAACMVSFYYKAGPRLGLPDVYAKNVGLKQSDVQVLADAEGLFFLEKANTKFSPASMMNNIAFGGPIWCAGDWYGAGHAIVLTGCDDAGALTFNDPDGGVEKTETVQWFNDHLFPGLMLIKNLNTY